MTLKIFMFIRFYRQDAPHTTYISLPTERPFVLVRIGGRCQHVRGMGVTEVFVHWDDSDLLNGDHVGGLHPDDMGGAKNHELHFCHYSSAASSVIVG